MVYESKHNSIGRKYIFFLLSVFANRKLEADWSAKDLWAGGCAGAKGCCKPDRNRCTQPSLGWIYISGPFYPRHHLLSFYNNIIVTKSMMVLMHSDTSYRQYYSRLFTITFIISYRNYPNFISSTSEAWFRSLFCTFIGTALKCILESQRNEERVELRCES